MPAPITLRFQILAHLDALELRFLRTELFIAHVAVDGLFLVHDGESLTHSVVVGLTILGLQVGFPDHAFVVVFAHFNQAFSLNMRIKRLQPRVSMPFYFWLAFVLVQKTEHVCSALVCVRILPLMIRDVRQHAVLQRVEQ